MSTYLILHKESDICRDTFTNLPHNHNDDNINLLWVEDADEKVTQQLPLEVHSILKHKQDIKKLRSLSKVENDIELTSDTSPIVMFYDNKTQSYIKHQGSRALMFMHNYTKNKQIQKINHTKNVSIENAVNISNALPNIQKLVDLQINHPVTSQQKQESIHSIIKQSAELQLQKIYQTLHSEHKPFVNEHGK